MILFHSLLPTALILAATVVAVLSAWGKRPTLLPHLGGLFWAAGAVCILVDGGSLKEILGTVLVLLLLTTLRREEGDKP